jgi:hypothetical protein
MQKRVEALGKVSGRLKMIEPVEGTDPPRVLCLCACGNTKVFLKRDIIQERARQCDWDCKRDRFIRRPHAKCQEILNHQREVIQKGPPKWDPVLRMGVFTSERK